MPDQTPTITIPDRWTRTLTTHIRQVLARVQAGPEKDRWPGGEGAPELIVLLLRSAPIPFAAVEGCAAANQIPLPPAIGAHIGLRLFVTYVQEQGLPRGHSFMSLDTEEQADFRAWLDTHDYAQKVVAQMQADAVTAGVPRPGRVLIYDDLRMEGSTLHAARHLVGRAFPGAEIESSIAGGMPGIALPEAPAGEALSRQEAEYTRNFLLKLARGYRRTPGGLVPIDSPRQLRRLGAYPGMANRYGEAFLLAFPAHVQEAMRAWGRAVDPAPPPPPKSALLLAGPAGIGKTTVLQQTLARLDPGEGVGPGGFVSVRRPDGAGYDLLTLQGERVPLALAGPHNFAELVPVAVPGRGQLVVDRAALYGPGASSLALSSLGRPVVLDEIGPLLFAFDDYCTMLWQMLNEQVPLLGAITAYPHPFAERIKAHPAVEVVAVTAENRERLPEKLAGRLATRMQGSPGLRRFLDPGDGRPESQ